MAGYSAEITQMLTVLGAQADTTSVTYVEDIVRSQVQDMLVSARDLAVRRGSRLLQTEDLLFLHRHEVCRSARLRAFLSWRDSTRRHYMSDADEAEGLDEIVGDALSVQKTPLRARWDVLSALSQHLAEQDEEALEDQQIAFAASQSSLQIDDSTTANLSLDDYRRYAEAKEATFTWRKAKRFQNFINMSMVNVDPMMLEEVTDILGFLAFETVKTICENGLTFKAPASAKKNDKGKAPEMPPPPVPAKRSRSTAATPEPSLEAPNKRPHLELSLSSLAAASPPPETAFQTPRTLSSHGLTATLSLPDGPFTTREPSPTPPTTPVVRAASSPPSTSAKALPVARAPLVAPQVDAAYYQLQEKQHKPKGKGLRSFQTGFVQKRTSFA